MEVLASNSKIFSKSKNIFNINMKYKYLSHLISEVTPMYGGYENLINIKKSRSIQDGDTSNNLTLEFPNHIGTHIDFPFHFSMNGNKLQDHSQSSDI